MPGDIDRITFRNGGANNAYTDTDYTIFHFDFAADRWEAALRDRGRPHAQPAHRRQARVRAGEGRRHQRAERATRTSRGTWSTRRSCRCCSARTAPYGHPGHRRDASTSSDATAEIIKAHYDKWYHPNNASLVVCRRLRSRQGAGEDQGAVRPHPEGGAAGAQDGCRRRAPKRPARLEMESKFEVPRLLMGFNTVRQRRRRLPGAERAGGDPQRRQDQPAVQEAGRGRAGRRDRRRQPTAPAAIPAGSRSRSSCSTGKDRDKAEKLVLAELKKLADEPVTDAELKRVQQQLAGRRHLRPRERPRPGRQHRPGRHHQRPRLPQEATCRASWPSRPPTCSASPRSISTRKSASWSGRCRRRSDAAGTRRRRAATRRPARGRRGRAPPTSAATSRSRTRSASSCPTA